MANLALIVLAAILFALAFIGCVVPVIPGPALAFAGLLCARGITPHDRPSMFTLAVALAFVVVVTVLDYVVPAMGARKFNCGKLGVFGCVVGTIVGLFFMPIGLLVGPFLGAMIGELIAGKEVRQSLKGAFGAFIGYAAGILLKLICCGSLAAMFMQATKTAT